MSFLLFLVIHFLPSPPPHSELFTNCLDMICTLLHSLSSEFHIALAGWGEEGKKAHTTCIKKLKTELTNSKSYCSSEIRQLFPLSQKSYTIATVKPPLSVSYSKGVTANERIKVSVCARVCVCARMFVCVQKKSHISVFCASFLTLELTSSNE